MFFVCLFGGEWGERSAFFKLCVSQNVLTLIYLKKYSNCTLFAACICFLNAAEIKATAAVLLCHHPQLSGSELK